MGVSTKQSRRQDKFQAFISVVFQINSSVVTMMSKKLLLICVLIVLAVSIHGAKLQKKGHLASLFRMDENHEHECHISCSSDADCALACEDDEHYCSMSTGKCEHD